MNYSKEKRQYVEGYLNDLIEDRVDSRILDMTYIRERMIQDSDFLKKIKRCVAQVYDRVKDRTHLSEEDKVWCVTTAVYAMFNKR